MRGAWRVLGHGASENADGMLDDWIQGSQCIANAVRGAGEIHNQGFATGAAHSSRERGGGKAREVKCPQSFSDPWRLALEHDARRLGRHVARTEPGAAGGEHEIRLVRVRPTR